MDIKVFELANRLNEELNNNPDVILLNELDKKLNDSFEVYTLSNRKDEALERYLSNKEMYGEESELTIASLKELSKIKKELNTNPLVKEYLKQYSIVRDLYMQINDIILSDFKGNKVCQ